MEGVLQIIEGDKGDINMVKESDRGTKQVVRICPRHIIGRDEGTLPFHTVDCELGVVVDVLYVGV